MTCSESLEQADDAARGLSVLSAAVAEVKELVLALHKLCASRPDAMQHQQSLMQMSSAPELEAVSRPGATSQHEPSVQTSCTPDPDQDAASFYRMGSKEGIDIILPAPSSNGQTGSNERSDESHGINTNQGSNAAHDIQVRLTVITTILL